MKKYLFFLSSFFILLQGYAQNWQWAASAARPSYVQMTDVIITDVHGNTVIGGEEAYTNTWGGVFIIKFDQSGNKLWEIYYPGSGTFGSLCSDSSGNIYATFRVPYVDSVYYPSNASILAKYDPAGNMIWCKQPGLWIALAEKTDAQDHIIATGSVVDTVHLENGYTLGALPGHSKRFLAKFDTDGECIWALQDDGGHYIPIVNSKGEIYTKATMYDSTTVGKGSHQVILDPANGQSYCAKYDSAGTLIWVKQLHTSAIAPDADGNLYTLECDISDIAHNSNRNAYIIKYDSQGNLIWKRTHFYIDHWYKFAMQIGSDGNIFTTGGFTNYMTIDSATVYDGGNTRAFVAKIDSSGALQWITASSGAGGAGAKDITIANGNEIFIAGDIGSGESIFGSHSTTQANGVFAAKLIDGSSSLATNEIKSISNFIVYPNPSEDLFNVFYSGRFLHATINIRNQLGQLILSKKYSSKNELHETFDLSAQPKGIYFIELVTGEAKEVKKIIVE